MGVCHTDENKLAALLRTAYEKAGRNETACRIHLFGIQYADELKGCGCTLKHIAELAGLSSGYVTELSKGVKLAKYVKLREGGDSCGGN